MRARNTRPKHHASRPSAVGARTFHAVDIDNLLGDPRTTDRAEIEQVLASYRGAATYNPDDHVLIATGCNGLHVLETELAWRHAAHRRRPGRDGADNVILDELEWIVQGRRFDRVVIGSGDHIFADPVHRLRVAGIAVTVVATQGHLSRHLHAAAGPNIRLIRSANAGRY